MKCQTLRDKVIVITGASSGIGRLCAERFLLEGARVVLTAHNEAPMHQHIAELGMGPDRALVVRTDVADWDQVQALTAAAIRHFGHIDIWINNAGVNMYGLADDLDVRDIKRLLDVNLMGCIHGCKAVLPHFKARGRGTLINVSSVMGKVAAPYQSAYNATKFGVTGFSKALREELMPHPGIDVCTILPAGMNTPLSRNACSQFEYEPRPIPPIYDPAICVEAIYKAALRPKPEVPVGGIAHVALWGDRIAPFLTERVMSFLGYKTQKTRIPNHKGSTLYGPEGEIAAPRGDIGTTQEAILQLLMPLRRRTT